MVRHMSAILRGFGYRLHGWTPLIVLLGAADVQKGETNLEEDERIGVIMYAPHDPQHVAEQEEPESPIALEFSL